MTATIQQQDEQVELLRCTVGGRDYCLDMAHVRGLHRPEHLVPSGESSGPMGWAVEQGRTIPVYPVRPELDPEAQRVARAGQVIVLLEVAGESFGVVVERVTRIGRVPRSSIVPVPDLGSAARLVRGVVRFEDEQILQLEPESLSPSGPKTASPVQPTLPKLESQSEPPASDRSPRRGRRSSETGRRSKVVLFSTAEPRAGEPSVEFMLSVTQVAEILLPVTPLFVPGSPSAVQGLVVWRDRAVRVFDLDQILGFASGEAPVHRHILIAKAAQSREFSGLLIRPQVRILSLPLPHKLSQRFVPPELSAVQAVFERPGEMAVFLDIDRLTATVAG